MARLCGIAALALALACAEKLPGRKLAAGIGSGLAVHAGSVAFLLDAVHPDDRSVPEDLRIGALWLDGRKVGAGVSSQTGMYEFSPRGSELAFLAAWRFREGEGELWTAAPGAEPQKISPRARGFAWSPDGTRLAYVAPDALGIRGQGPVRIDGLQAIAWSPDGKRIAARAAAAAGGKLYAVDAASGAAREIAPGTSDFAFAPDGKLAALGPSPPKGGDRPLLLEGKEIGRATAFTFSPDGKRLALLSTGQHPGEAYGDLYELQLPATLRLIAGKVSDWRWSDAGELVCLARYDLRARAGTLMAGGREMSARVQSFSLYGRHLLYLVQAPVKGDFKLELWAADLGSRSAASRRIDEGVYGWDVSPDGSALFYKARCAGGPRSCALLRARLEGGLPELLAAGVAGFDLSRDGSRLLLQQPHRGAARAVDLAVISASGPPPGQPEPFVEETDPGSRFADSSGKQIAYAVIAAGKGGVYLAEIP